MKLDDPRWNGLEGGYRVPLDPRPLLRKLEFGGAQRAAAWTELWENLYHQGDVGLASYAAVPPLARVEAAAPEPDWQAYALVASIDLARDGSRPNPPIPDWLEDDYREGIAALAQAGLGRLACATTPELTRSILAVVALWKGARAHGRVLLELDEDEVKALEAAAFG